MTPEKIKDVFLEISQARLDPIAAEAATVNALKLLSQYKADAEAAVRERCCEIVISLADQYACRKPSEGDGACGNSQVFGDIVDRILGVDTGEDGKPPAESEVPT